ncbi:NAD(P)/FAD-dependent oxidoreductase [Burkholderia oklahomensis]|uniref:FAD dependent oxidoreductase family protein n=1 Tax=Burkholderia oklahomensis TaxID=342113 RepID=A0AAI8BEE4_9BURK|nr:FAD-binding oxidoreductase [Burkholderia oklahomensis]AIO70678.1 FAD dependent oxidoreductase family protein [Burkholderia oklahomensis]AJX35221.1 FAD dependent oxidoreductase family protein [Burkholderia oklahomensis C6786]AOI40605.1 N-methyl-l-tryptophan oxidase [Burkholderia oklahomensis EO147]AOI50242.1 N-methyl-l-tryptophan oxidase [Burkholderia oklahomensis C6786]KUY51615.1 N-methyl-l-tryptophan oxidase [Burkholderia oklahomensis EO147]
MMHHYEHAVVGKGLIGAATLCYLSVASENVAVIGADEPLDGRAHRGLFSSHHDAGRIATRLSRDHVWARLVHRSMDEYARLEQVGGARSYRPLGMLYVAPLDDPIMQERVRLARNLKVDHVELASAACAGRLSPLRFPTGFHGLLEHAPAGIFGPLALRHNHLTIAKANGASVICAIVTAIRRRAAHWELNTACGRRYTANKVLVSAGAYSNCFDLLPRKLDLRVKSEHTVLLQVSGAESERLRALPPISYRIDSRSISDVYVVPPMLYPDGNHYLKLGANTDADIILPSFDAIQQWMISGSDEPRSDMREAMFHLLPDLDLLSARAKRCLVTYSAHGKPYIDELDDGLFVATAGNGAAAACSDTLGRLAADLMTGRPWPAGFERRDFQRRFADSHTSQTAKNRG